MPVPSIASPGSTSQDEREDRRYRPGSEEDFVRLYRSTYQRIFRTVFALVEGQAAAEDCTQDAYLKAYLAWPRWTPDAPAEAWLHRIAIRTAISHRRREHLRHPSQLIARLGPPRMPDPTEQTAAPELIRELRALPPKQAAALVLRHLHGYTNRDIAHALGVPERTIATRLATARRRMRRGLRDQWGASTLPALGVPLANESDG